MGEESDHQSYTVRVKDRRIGLNPYKWAIYRAGWPSAVKRAASVYRTAEKCRIAGALALREFLANLTKRKKNRNDSRPSQAPTVAIIDNQGAKGGKKGGLGLDPQGFDASKGPTEVL